jgi:hypothetical protein
MSCGIQPCHQGWRKEAGIGYTRLVRRPGGGRNPKPLQNEKDAMQGIRKLLTSHFVGSHCEHFLQEAGANSSAIHLSWSDKEWAVVRSMGQQRRTVLQEQHLDLPEP